MKSILIVIDMRESFKMGKLMEREYTSGQMERYMMGNGKMEPKKDMEFGKEFMEIHI